MTPGRRGGGRMGRRGARIADPAAERGAVAAEFAVVLPVVVLVLLFGVTVLGASSNQVRLQDVAADAARLAARGESPARVLEAVEAAVAGASADIEEHEDTVCVIVRLPSRLAMNLTATGCALAGGL